jgi:hypothetical protein
VPSERTLYAGTLQLGSSYLHRLILHLDDLAAETASRANAQAEKKKSKADTARKEAALMERLLQLKEDAKQLQFSLDWPKDTENPFDTTPRIAALDVGILACHVAPC